MAKQTINIGASPNDGTGTPLRTAFDYTNQNFTELYTATGPSGNNIVVPGSATISGDLTVRTNKLAVTSTGVGCGTASPATELEVRAANFAEGTIRLFSPVDGSTASPKGSFFSFRSGTGAGTETARLSSFNRFANVLGGDFVISTADSSNVLQTRATIDSSGVATWSNVGGTSGTAMTLNSTGLGVGTSPSYNIDVLAATLPTISVRSTLAGASNARLYLECAGANSGHITYNRSLQALQLGANGGTTAQVTLDSVGNVGIGVSTFGTSAAKVLSIATGTEPTTGPAGSVQFFTSTRSASNTIPAIFTEGSGVTNAAITNTTVTNKIAIKVNGTIYYLLATTSAA